MQVFIVASLVAYTALVILLLRVSDNDLSSKYYVKIKMLTSSTFILIYLIAFLVSGRIWQNASYLIIGLALLLCWLGDLFMGYYNQKAKKQDMIKGILSFALAHIVFLVSMYVAYPYLNIFAIICPVAMLLLFICITWAFHLKMGRLKPACYLYSVLVSAMFTKALCDAFSSYSLGRCLMAIGAVLFFVSDFSIIFLYFYHYKNRDHRKKTHYFNLLTYYYGIFLIVMSILFP